MELIITPDAQRDFAVLPIDIQQRIRQISARLIHWPAVSGAKPLRREWKGCYRIRTGDWRVIFRPVGEQIWIVRMANRRDVYED